MKKSVVAKSRRSSAGDAGGAGASAKMKAKKSRTSTNSNKKASVKIKEHAGFSLMDHGSRMKAKRGSVDKVRAEQVLDHENTQTNQEISNQLSQHYLSKHNSRKEQR